MALLQISEPGGKAADTAASRPHRRAVGIDLGTTNSLVATKCGTEVEVLKDDQGRALLPSAVYYGAVVSADSGSDDSQPLQDVFQPIVGAAALERMIEQPADTVVSVKRLLGRSLEEINTTYPQLPYRFDESCPPQAPALLTAAGSKSPLQVSADILKSLAARAEARLGGPVEGAVVTVPAYFNDAQRQQTKDAAAQAGLPVLRLLNEPTAAAVAYGLDKSMGGGTGNDIKQERRIVVFDLGGGTFDVSLLCLSKGVFEVLATGGDTALGGDDFDQAIVDWVKQQAEQQAEQQAQQTSAHADLRQQAQLRTLARAAKHALSESPQTAIHWQGQELVLSREQFAALSEDLLARCLRVCRRVLRDAGLDTEQVHNIILVGGATRMPVLQQAVADLFGKPPLTDLDPDQVVAVGAAIQADVLAGNKSADDFLLLDVTPLSLGIETMGELVEKIIPRNTAIPAARAQEFTTFKDGQTVMSLHVVQGEREAVADCRSLARFELRGIPPMTAGAAKIRVSFQVDADGLLGVTAEETSSGRKAEVQVKPSYGLDAETIEDMLQSSRQQAEADMKLRALKEAEVDARRLITALQAAMTADSQLPQQLLKPQEQGAIDAAVAGLEKAIAAADVQAIRDGTSQLNAASADFAARRMDLHVAQALKGTSIE